MSNLIPKSSVLVRSGSKSGLTLLGMGPLMERVLSWRELLKA